MREERKRERESLHNKTGQDISRVNRFSSFLSRGMHIRADFFSPPPFLQDIKDLITHLSSLNVHQNYCKTYSDYYVVQVCLWPICWVLSCSVVKKHHLPHSNSNNVTYKSVARCHQIPEIYNSCDTEPQPYDTSLIYDKIPKVPTV